MKTSEARRNDMLDTLTANADNGYLRIYTGSIPTAPEESAAGTLLAELRLGATAFAAATGGVATANAITAEDSALDTGTAGWFRVLASDGTTALWDGTCGTSGADLNLTNISIESGDEVTVDAFTVTFPA